MQVTVEEKSSTNAKDLQMKMYASDVNRRDIGQINVEMREKKEIINLRIIEGKKVEIEVVLHPLLLLKVVDQKVTQDLILILNQDHSQNLYQNQLEIRKLLIIII